MLAPPRDVDAVQGDRAAIGEVAAADQIEHGRLARAVAADDRDKLPLSDRQIDPVDRDLDAAAADGKGLGQSSR